MMDLFVGAESGQIYYFHRAYIEDDCSSVRLVSIEARSSSIGSRPGPEQGGSLPVVVLLFVILLVAVVIVGRGRIRAQPD